MAIAPQITQAFDDVAPVTGAVYYGDYTNDSAPVIRVSLGDQAAAGQTLQLGDNGLTIGAAIALTGEHLAHGYVDVPLAGLSDGWNLLTAALVANGATIATSLAFALGLATAAPPAPVIISADDNVGAATGVLQDGARTDDSAPTLHISEAGLPPPPEGSPGHAPYGGPALLSGHVQLYENGHFVGDAMLSYGGEVTITPGELSPGTHMLTAVAVDRAGNVSAPSAPFHLTIGPDAGLSSGEVLTARAGFLDIFAGSGSDTITGADAPDTLRGGQGDDFITGGTAYNEINGNQGQDTIIGRSAVGDSLMGGQGNDVIDATASTGHDSINGNRGDDVIRGGAGGSSLWGGQGDDVIYGGAGDDWISGDRGHNTVSGGAGADVFYGLASGYELVTDFSAAQGDRVQIDAGATYQVSQRGSDTLVDISGGGQVVLANVQAASLQGGWIFQA
jgi:Ca2+-binding RTX toxin-like protein